MTAYDHSYEAFWTLLVPQSNRRTGFSIRGATKRSWVAFDLVGFRFSYQIDQALPNALFAFSIVRSDDTEIYAHLLQQRAAIEHAFGDGLRWQPAALVPGNRSSSPTISSEIICPPFDQLPCERWTAVQAQMIDTMMRLEQAIAPHVTAWLPE
jgi:hypothetical protein